MGIILSIIFFVVSFLVGINLLLVSPIFHEKTLTVATGIVLGTVLLTTFVYLSTIFFLLSSTLVTAIILLATLFLALTSIKYKTWSTFKSLPLNKTALAVLAILLLFSLFITPKLLFYNQDGGLSTSTINAYGDLGFHMANITNLAYSSTVPPANPILSGTRLTYPFFSNFLSAILLVSGANFSQSVVWPAFLFIPLALFLFYHLTLYLTRNRAAAALSLALFALGGGTLGWVRITNHFNIPHQSLFDFLANLPINYTGHADDPLGFYLINPIISLLLPQRSFMFGLSIAFILILLILVSHSSYQRNKIMVLAGLLAGLLPLWHAHTVLALIPVIIILLIINPGRHWIYFFIITFLVGLPGVLYFLTSHASSSAFPHLQLGWMAHRQNIFLFWFKNSGLFLPITIYGFFLRAPKATKALAISGLLLFAAANIWLFAAWEWDNTKIFVYWILFTLPLATYATIFLWRKSKYYFRGIIIAFIVFHLISGSLDVFRLALPNLPTWPEWDADNIAMAQYVQTHTARQDSILIAPYHNSPAALAGRSVYLGFPGHVWTHGNDYQDRESAIGLFYTGAIDALPHQSPQYAIISPVEYSFYPNLRISPSWQLITTIGRYSLYRLP